MPGLECGQHFAHVAADASDDSNSTTGQFRFQRLRDAGADQCANAKLRKSLNPIIGCGFVHRLHLAGNLSAVSPFEQQQLPGNVKDR